MPATSTYRSYTIVPAAGRSQRMGQPKLLLPWRGLTVIEHVLAAWQGSRVGQVVVVVHPDDTDLAAVCRRAGVQVVIPATPPPEMKSSVLHGLDFIRRQESPSASDAWLLAPADMPQLSTAVINEVLAAHEPGRPAIIVPCHAGQPGHPVLFPWRLADEAAQLGPDEGLNCLRERFAAREIEVSDPAILADLDTPADYHSLPEFR